MQARIWIQKALAKMQEVKDRTPILHAYEALQINLWTVRALELNELTGLALPSNYSSLRATTLKQIADFKTEYPRQSELLVLEDSLKYKANFNSILGIPLHFETVE
ncbi:hypothetical protein D3C72_2144720 [compost metagenome]